MKYLRLFDNFNLIEEEIRLLPQVIETKYEGKRQTFKLKVETDSKYREWVLSYVNKKGDFCLKLAHHDIEIIVELLLKTIVNGNFKIIE